MFLTCRLYIFDGIHASHAVTNAFKAAHPEDVPPVVAGSKNAILSIYRRHIFLLAVVTQDGVFVHLTYVRSIRFLASVVDYRSKSAQ